MSEQKQPNLAAEEQPLSHDEPMFHSEESKAVWDAVLQMEQEYETQQREREEEEKKNSLFHQLTQFSLNQEQKQKLGTWGVGIFLALFVTIDIIQIVSLFRAWFFLRWELFAPSYFSLFVGSFLPLFLMAISSLYKFWNFHNKKKLLIYFSIFHFILQQEKLVFLCTWLLFIPAIVSQGANRFLSANFQVWGLRGIFFLTLSLFALIYFRVFRLSLLQEKTIKQILDYRFENTLAAVLAPSHEYSLKIVQRMDNGRAFVIREKDRFLHLFFNGVTGSGKTSSSFIPQIVSDLNKALKNSKIIQKKIFHYLKKGDLHLKSEPGETIFLNQVEGVTPNGERILRKLSKYRSMGITVIAPNSDFTDQVYELCKARNIPCNRVDPVLIDGHTKEGFTGFNPFYISPNVDPWKYHFEIVKKATLIADVFQMVNDLKGKGDQYFTSVNRSVTVCFSILLMVTYPELHDGDAPTMEDLQDLVNDFSRVEKHMKHGVRYDYKSKFTQIENDFEREHGYRRYQFVEDFIRQVALNSDSQVVAHANGLKMLINEFVTNPLIRNILCSKKSVDMDAILAEGQVTVVNYALEFGQSDSVAFGELVLLSLIDAVLRRPGTERTRTPHSLNIDELPVLLHPQMEKMFSLFRQYRVAMSVAVQSLSQMDKSSSTQYLKEVILGNCAHHFVFGRSGLEEMKLYSQLSGTESRAKENTTVQQTSLTMADTSLRTSTAYTEEEVAVVSEYDVRNKAFQEVTVFSVRNGNILPPFAGRTSFISGKEKKLKKQKHYDFSPFFIRINEDSVHFTTEEARQSIRFETVAKVNSEENFFTVENDPEEDYFFQVEDVPSDEPDYVSSPTKPTGQGNYEHTEQSTQNSKEESSFTIENL